MRTRTTGIHFSWLDLTVIQLLQYRVTRTSKVFAGPRNLKQPLRNSSASRVPSSSKSKIFQTSSSIRHRPLDGIETVISDLKTVRGPKKHPKAWMKTCTEHSLSWDVGNGPSNWLRPKQKHTTHIHHTYSYFVKILQVVHARRSCFQFY